STWAMLCPIGWYHNPRGQEGINSSPAHRVRETHLSSEKQTSFQMRARKLTIEFIHELTNFAPIGIGGSVGSNPQRSPGSLRQSWTYIAVSRSSGPGGLSTA